MKAVLVLIDKCSIWLWSVKQKSHMLFCLSHSHFRGAPPLLAHMWRSPWLSHGSWWRQIWFDSRGKSEWCLCLWFVWLWNLSYWDIQEACVWFDCRISKASMMPGVEGSLVPERAKTLILIMLVAAIAAGRTSSYLSGKVTRHKERNTFDVIWFVLSWIDSTQSLSMTAIAWIVRVVDRPRVLCLYLPSVKQQ